jgi:hypothetical protein
MEARESEEDAEENENENDNENENENENEKEKEKEKDKKINMRMGLIKNRKTLRLKKTREIRKIKTFDKKYFQSSSTAANINYTCIAIPQPPLSLVGFGWARGNECNAQPLFYF